jgi:TolA-binding protein
MKAETCSRIGLVEALRDGRLGAGDRASMERHLASCEECRAASIDLERIASAIREPLERASELEHQRARTSLLERASRMPAPVAQPTPYLAYVAAAAVLVLASAGAFAVGRSTASGETAKVAAHLRLAERFAPRRTTLVPSEHARFERASEAGVDVVTLTDGELEIARSATAASQRFVVRTKDAEIEVRATSFRVEAEGGRIRGVAVVEGSVEVRYAGFTAVIPSGGSWRANGEGTPTDAKVAPPVDPSALVTPKPPPPPPTAVASRPAPTHVAMRAPEPKREVAPPAPAAPPAPEKATEKPEAPRGPSAEAREFADAVRAVGQGDYAGAASRLDAFAAAHPRDARADDADYLRAIALQRAGRVDEARAAARRYLAAHPEGAHRVEAQAIAGR